ncbi:MAG: hypothetical protein R6W71_01865 [Bacteroidales bacterium]|jgi:hypothetical protein
MKKLLISLAMLCLGMAAISQQDVYDLYIPGDESSFTPPSAPADERGTTNGPIYNILYDNGPLVTNPGSGFGGADASVLQTALGMNTYGFGHQIANGWWVADEFTVPPGGWDIIGFGFFAYQTGSTTTSTFTAVQIMIFDGPPGAVGTNTLFGDNNTNRLTSSEFTNIYRVLDNAMSNTDRPIFRNDCMFNLQLPQGTYWVAWQAAGTLSSGPWVPPISVLGQTTTGNGQQFTGSWAIAIDTGTITAQGLPFFIYGPDPVPVTNWALFIGIGLILVFAMMRFRRIG